MERISGPHTLWSHKTQFSEKENNQKSMYSVCVLDFYT